MPKHSKKNIKNKNAIRRIILLIVFTLVALLFASGAYVYLILSNMQVNDDTIMELESLAPEDSDSDDEPDTIVEELLQTPAPTAAPETNEDFGVINIAVFGMDNRYKHTIIGGRSDVNMILTIDKINNEVRLTSIIRDTLIYIDPLNDYNRINAAIVYADGPEGAVECIEQEFGINIDHYMVTNFVGMARIIDAIGGVKVYVSSGIAKDCKSAISEMNSIMGYSPGSNYITSSGNITLNGIQAVAYMRQRKREGGFARDDKQKSVLTSAKEKLASMSVQEINDLLVVVSENIKMDMSPLELLDVTMNLYACKDNDYSAIRIPFDDTYQLARYNGMSIVQYDKDSNLSQLYDYIYRGLEPTGE